MAETTARRPRAVGIGVVGAAVTLAVMLLAETAAATIPGRCLRQPVDAPITRSFEAPPCPFCAGHRGITFAVPAGAPVRAAAAGEVTFSGVVVGTRYVVVRHGDGLLATYGGLSSTALDAGDAVAAGSVVGRSGDELYFGLRTGPDVYIDPALYLAEEVVPPYLVPTDGTSRRDPPPARLECEAGSSR